MWADKVSNLIHLFEDGQLNRRELVEHLTKCTGSLAAAIAEVGSADACLTLLENFSAEIALFSIDRIVERHGHLAPIRENLVARDDLPICRTPR